jgi:hypothetical protein
MQAFALDGRDRPTLDDARESLAYWEDRAHRLPRHAVRRRREAREMAVRWQGRVVEAEREVYGRGLLGALVLLARRTVHAALVATVALLALAVAGVLAAVELLAALLRAL